MSDAMTRGGLFTGFEEFRVPHADDVGNALRVGILAVDTNVLLNLYRYNEATVTDLLKILTSASERLFAPHQVVREFWRNRQTVIGSLGVASKDVNTSLQKNETSTKDAITRWAKSIALESNDRDRIHSDIEEFFEGLRQKVEDQPTRAGTNMLLGDDKLLAQLVALLEGKVGSQLSEEDWGNALKEGERRVQNSVPPGYMDSEKLESDLPEGASGDYILWLQLLLEGRQRKQPLVLVTADTKEDWWNRAERGQVIGPRHELINEYYKYSHCRFFLIEPTELLRHSDVLGVGTSEESVHDIERVQNEQPDYVPWPFSAVLAVLSELEAQGLCQADVIREAAAHDGRISRTRVYQIAGRAEDQMLRGFTRPVKRITGELQDRREVPYGVAPLLSAVYETGVRSSHFEVPTELTDMILESPSRSVPQEA